MSEKLGKLVSFRTWQKNQERVEYAQKLDVNVSELLNEILDENFSKALQKHLKRKEEQIRAALAAPLP